MPNLVVTNACNQSCPFCFASEYRAETAAYAARMSLDEVGAHIAFGGEWVRFCGGEPTLHPDFTRMLDLALARRGGRVLVMTNGLWPDAVREHMARLAGRRARRITFLVNVLEAARYSEAARSRLFAALAVMDPRTVTLGLTVHHVPFDPTHLFTLASRFGFAHLRYSVAAPNITDPRSWSLEPERDFPALAEAVCRLVVESRGRGLHVHADCGYIPPCFFTPPELEELRRLDHGAPAVEHACHGPIDIGPGGEAWRCYGLYALIRARTAEHASASALASDFEQRTRALGEHLLLERCATCNLRQQGGCGGGCHAFRVVRSLRARARACGVDIASDDRLLAAVPHVEAERLWRVQHHGRAMFMLHEHGEWVRLDATPLEQRLLDACDGATSLRKLLPELAAGASGVTPAGVARAVRRLYARDVITLGYRA